MARAADQFRQTDVTFWGIVALVCGAIALLSANLSALMPEGVFAGLHATRLSGASVNEMHAELASLEDEEARLRTTSAQIEQRFETAEHDAGSMERRVSALEVSVPKLTEAYNTRPAPVTIDPSIVTGSIGTPQKGFTSPATTEMPPLLTDSGLATQSAASAPTASAPTSVAAKPGAVVESTSAASSPAPAAQPALGAIHLVPMQTALPARTINAPSPAWPRPDIIAEGAISPKPATAAPVTTAPATAPPTTVANVQPTATKPAQPDVKAVGVAIGPAVQPAAALQAWQGLAAKVGILLVGTSPLLADDPAGSNGKVLVAGPLDNIATATALCANIGKAGLTCMPMPYVGAPISGGTATQ